MWSSSCIFGDWESFTVTFQALFNEPKQQFPTEVTEGGCLVGVDVESVRMHNEPLVLRARWNCVSLIIKPKEFFYRENCICIHCFMTSWLRASIYMYTPNYTSSALLFSRIKLSQSYKFWRELKSLQIQVKLSLALCRQQRHNFLYGSMKSQFAFIPILGQARIIHYPPSM